jgi:hypothetical protein
MLGNRSREDVGVHQAMRPNATGDQFAREVEQRLNRKPGRAVIAIRRQRFEPLPILHNKALFQSHAKDRITKNIEIIWLRANDRKSRAFMFEQVANSNLDLSVLIAQRHLLSQVLQEQQQPDQRADRAEHPSGNVMTLRAHAIPNRLMTILRYRQLYACQNQFISRINFSCLSMRQIRTSATQFSSISCPRPAVLRRLPLWALGSAPADLSVGWRDIPHVLTDPSWYSEENVKKILTNKPEAVSKLLSAVFRTNHLTRAERELLAIDLDLTPTPSAQRLIQRRRQANGGLSKAKGAHA